LLPIRRNGKPGEQVVLLVFREKFSVFNFDLARKATPPLYIVEGQPDSAPHNWVSGGVSLFAHLPAGAASPHRVRSSLHE
jgi:hypothetical protein